MKCHWTARSEIALSIPLLFSGVFLAFARQKETKRYSALMSFALGVLIVLMPTFLIGVCAKPDMLCAAVMKPVLILTGSVVAAMGAICFIIGFRQSASTDQSESTTTERSQREIAQKPKALTMTVPRLIFRDATRNPFRSGVVFCCALLLAALPFGVTFITIGGRAGLQTAMNRLGADLLIVPENLATKVETALLTGKPYPAWMDRANVEKIARVSGVVQASPQLYLATLPNAACCSASEMFIMAYEPATDFTLRAWLNQNLGRDLGRGEVIGGSRVYATDAGENIRVYGTLLRLKGKLAPSGTGLDNTLFMSFETAREVARMSETRAVQKLVIPTNQISAILVKLQPEANPQKVAYLIEQAADDVLAMQSPEMVQSARRELTGLMRIIVIVLVLVWLLSVAVSGLIFSLAAHERRRELGVLRALGSSRSFVFRLLLAEAAALALAGAATGLVLCLAIAFCFRDAIVFLLEIPFLFPPPMSLAALIFGGLLAAVLSVVLAACVPVWRISRMEPALAMRE